MNNLEGLYKSLWESLIRPQRRKYSNYDLGGTKFSRAGTFARRLDFELKNCLGESIYTSVYFPCDANFSLRSLQSVVIYCHTLNGDRVEGVQEIPVLLEKGILAVIFDFRASGRGNGEFVTLGWLEAFDLDELIRFSREKLRMSNIGLWGRSMGAAASVFYLSETWRKEAKDWLWRHHGKKIEFMPKSAVDGIVLDSCLESLRNSAVNLAQKRSPIPEVVIDMALSILDSKMAEKTHINIPMISPSKYLKEVKTPLLMVSGTEDQLVPVQTFLALFSLAGSAVKQFKLFEGTHTQVRPIEVGQAVINFFEEIFAARRSYSRVRQIEKLLLEEVGQSYSALLSDARRSIGSPLEKSHAHKRLNSGILENLSNSSQSSIPQRLNSPASIPNRSNTVARYIEESSKLEKLLAEHALSVTEFQHLVQEANPYAVKSTNNPLPIPHSPAPSHTKPPMFMLKDSMGQGSSAITPMRKFETLSYRGLTVPTKINSQNPIDSNKSIITPKTDTHPSTISLSQFPVFPKQSVGPFGPSSRPSQTDLREPFAVKSIVPQPKGLIQSPGSPVLFNAERKSNFVFADSSVQSKNAENRNVSPNTNRSSSPNSNPGEISETARIQKRPWKVAPPNYPLPHPIDFKARSNTASVEKLKNENNFVNNGVFKSPNSSSIFPQMNFSSNRTSNSNVNSKEILASPSNRFQPNNIFGFYSEKDNQQPTTLNSNISNKPIRNVKPPLSPIEENYRQNHNNFPKQETMVQHAFTTNIPNTNYHVRSQSGQPNYSQQPPLRSSDQEIKFSFLTERQSKQQISNSIIPPGNTIPLRTTSLEVKKPSFFADIEVKMAQQALYNSQTNSKPLSSSNDYNPQSFFAGIIPNNTVNPQPVWPIKNNINNHFQNNQFRSQSTSVPYVPSTVKNNYNYY